MSIWVTRGQIIDAGHNDGVDDDDLTKKDDFTSWQTCSKHGPGLLTVCIGRLHVDN